MDEKNEQTLQNKIDGVSKIQLTGNDITKEQMRDVYASGTSDGVILLAGGESRSLLDAYEIDESEE
jgi:hypothetical protein